MVYTNYFCVIGVKHIVSDEKSRMEHSAADDCISSGQISLNLEQIEKQGFFYFFVVHIVLIAAHYIQN